MSDTLPSTPQAKHSNFQSDGSLCSETLKKSGHLLCYMHAATSVTANQSYILHAFGNIFHLNGGAVAWIFFLQLILPCFFSLLDDSLGNQKNLGAGELCGITSEGRPV